MRQIVNQIVLILARCPRNAGSIERLSNLPLMLAGVAPRESQAGGLFRVVRFRIDTIKPQVSRISAGYPALPVKMA